MALIFPKWTNEIPRVGLLALGASAVLGTFAVWFWASPWHTDVGYKPKQPIPYSHALHAGELGMDCRYCHFMVERSAFAGVPPTQVCMNCHRQVRPNSEMLTALRESYGDGDPEHDGGAVPWKRIHKLPDFVYFNHSAHVGLVKEGAAVGCVSCHGRIDQMAVVKQVASLSMTWCLECHENPAPNLRPIDQLTNMTWTPEQTPGWTQRVEEIVARLDPPGRRNAVHQQTPAGERLVPTANCSGCHR